MGIDTKILLQLRRITGAGMSDCQSALEESNNDIDKAIEILRKKGAVKAAKKADREAHEGVIEITRSSDKKTGSMVQIHCESDFVAKNNEFITFVKNLADHGLNDSAEQKFTSEKEQLILKIGENIIFGREERVRGDFVESYLHANKKVGCLVAFNKTIDEEVAHDIAMHIAATNPYYINKDEVPQEVIEKEKEIYKEQLKAEKKPENIVEKITQGKLQKFYVENCLNLQAFIKDDSMSVDNYLQSKAGKDAKVTKFIRFNI